MIIIYYKIIYMKLEFIILYYNRNYNYIFLHQYIKYYD